MAVYRLSQRMNFPDPWLSDGDGLLAVGGDLSVDRLVLAYRHGIFPWYNQGQPILWWSPDPRMVLFPDELRVPRSLVKRLRRGDWRLSVDEAFQTVIRRCSRKPRPGQAGTWIVPDVVDAYVALHKAGHAHSVEAWEGDRLVGGLYGVSIGGVFCGESMFADAPDASKAAFATLVRRLPDWGVGLVDCQMHTEHLARFGARLIERRHFLDRVEALRDQPLTPGAWTTGDLVTRW